MENTILNREIITFFVAPAVSDNLHCLNYVGHAKRRQALRLLERIACCPLGAYMRRHLGCGVLCLRRRSSDKNSEILLRFAGIQSERTSGSLPGQLRGTRFNP